MQQGVVREQDPDVGASRGAALPGGEGVRVAGAVPVAVCVLVVLVLLVGPALVVIHWTGTEPYELLRREFPGYDVAYPVAVLRTIADAASTLTVGALVWVLFLRERDGREVTRRGPDLATLRVASVVWATAAVLLIIFDALDASGTSADRLSEPGAVGYLLGATYPPGAWIVACVGASYIVVVSQLAKRWTTLLTALVPAALGALAPVVVGQVLVGINHDFGGDAGTFQTLAAALVLGTLLMACIRLATGQPIPPVSQKRLARIAIVGLPVMVACEIVLAWFKLAGSPIEQSITGWQILARTAALCALAAVLGALALRARQGRLEAHHLWRASIPVAILAAAWIGITVSMTRIPPPHYFAETSIQQVFFGFEVSGPPGLIPLLTQWRFNLLFATLAAIGSGAYLWAVYRLRRRGDGWPRGRTTAWLLGWLVLVLVTNSGLGRYSGTDLGVHMGVHMGLAMLSPLLLVLGGPVTLFLRALPSTSAARSWLVRVLSWRGMRVLQHPLLVMVVFVGSYYALYMTDLFGDAMRFHWAHQLMNLHFLLSGYLYYGLIIGVDRVASPIPHIGKLGYVLAAMPFHAFFGVILMTSDRLVAESFYGHLGLPWADLRASQELAGGIAWAGGELPLMIVIVVLAVQWARQDTNEARRNDRRASLGLDEEYEAYNQMLDRLARRGPVPSTDAKDSM